MPNFSLVAAVGAGGVIQNIFAGSAFEFINRPSRVAIAALADSTATIGDIVATIQFGPEVQLENGILMLEGAAGVGPKLPDDICCDDVAAAGDRLVMRVTNANVAPMNVLVKVRVIALA